MKKLTLLTSLCALLATAAMVPHALAQDVSAMLNIHPNMKGSIYNSNLDMGDTLFLKLKNTSATPVTFRTTNQIGTEATVTVKPNEVKDLNITFKEFDKSLDYVVVNNHGYKLTTKVGDKISGKNAVNPSDLFKAYLEMSPNSSGTLSFGNKELNVGEEIILTLKNSTSKPLYFTSRLPLGLNHNYEVKANSERLVVFNYTQLQGDDIEYVVTRNPKWGWNVDKADKPTVTY